MSAHIKGILAGAKVQIACLEDDPITIIGYSVVKDECLEWIFVRERLQKNGIGTMLFKEANIKTVSPYITKLGKALADARGLKEKVYESQSGSPKRDPAPGQSSILH
jgi:hypothetical protein